MPANLTPQYRKAEEQFKSATTDKDKVLALEEMLRIIPRHKGTEHIQADIKRKLSRFRQSAADDGKKNSGKHVDIFHIPRSGAGQVVLIGTTNSGKSSLVGALTSAHVNIADHPFATSVPVPGMMKYEDIPIELVDMPPITADYSAPGQVGTYRSCDIIGVVIDLSADVLEQMQICINYLDSHRLISSPKAASVDQCPALPPRKALVICTKCDVSSPDTMETLAELYPNRFDFVKVSVRTGQGLAEFAEKIFLLLDIVRIYAKKPGKEPDMKEPFTLPKGSSITDLAFHIHRELAEKLKAARCWGKHVHDGQNVQRAYILHDRDIIELHF